MSRLPLAWRARAAAGALIIPPLLSVVSLSRLSSRLGRSLGQVSSPPPDPEELAAWVDRVLHRLPGPWRHTCLKRSAVLYYLIRRAGMPAELCIGVRRDPKGAVAAHAWLLRDGQPFLERDPVGLAAYQTIARFPEKQTRPQ